MKDVIITVKTTNIIEGESTTAELTSEGRYGSKDGDFLITYKDSMLSDEYGDVNTAIKFCREETIVISRSGAYNSKFTIEKGKRCNCAYSTPFGTMTMGFFGEEISSTLNEQGGRLRFKYIVDINKSQVNKNEIDITVKEV